MKISILGAPGTGKTQLAGELVQHFQAQTGTIQALICDNTPLMNAVYNDLMLGDCSLYNSALAHQRQYDLTLLTGLDLPLAHRNRDKTPSQEQADARLRTILQEADIAYGVVYGRGAQRLHNALRLIRPQEITPRTGWNWVCEKCSDPDCEYRLFTGLQDSKAAAHPSP